MAMETGGVLNWTYCCKNVVEAVSMMLLPRMYYQCWCGWGCRLERARDFSKTKGNIIICSGYIALASSRPDLCVHTNLNKELETWPGDLTCQMLLFKLNFREYFFSFFVCRLWLRHFLCVTVKCVVLCFYRCVLMIWFSCPHLLWVGV